MNKKGSGPSLTWMIISAAAFVAIIILSLQAYTDVLTSYNVTADTGFMATYQNITAQKGLLDNAKITFSDLSIGSAITGAITLIQSLLGFGFSAISSLVQSISIIQSLIEIVGQAYPELAVVFWFITFVVVIYVAARFIKVIRQDPEEA